MGSKLKEFEFYPECASCRVKMAAVSRLEYEAFLDGSRLCFDCEPFGTVGQPVELIPVELGTLNMLARLQLSDRMADEFCRAIAHARAHEHARAPGLSSYTKLNRNTKNLGVLEDLYDVRICPQCDGLSFSFELYGGQPCGMCGDKGSIRVMKRWIFYLLGGVLEDA